ncbi:hypothetical protein M405DRAFT_835062 [Rhizopogon salebrosus TDB-379]|nr:hypothetical protein M405DRAFT_835062 [Rhizopogon salebrosus TDB-379]
MATHSTTGSSTQVISTCANQLQKSYQSLTCLTRSLTFRPYLNGGPATKA